MKTLCLLKRLVLAGMVALSLGLSLTPRAHASVIPNDSTHTSGPAQPVCDGNESHGKGG
jgi:hypothetical protein